MCSFQWDIFAREAVLAVSIVPYLYGFFNWTAAIAIRIFYFPYKAKFLNTHRPG